MKFIPNHLIKNQMLKEIGLENIDDLFSDIPDEIQIKDLKLDNGLTQIQTENKLRKIASKNKSCKDILTFTGGNIKPHYIPAVVKSIISRSEFYSAYTPYQSEASQGFLHAMFEYQSLIAEITGMDVANASLYDEATALGEAALMCSRVKRRKNKFVIPANISWEKKSILKNYTTGANIEIIEIPYDSKSGKVDKKRLNEIIDDDTAGVYIENPNFFGVFEDDIRDIERTVHDKDSLFVVGIHPLSLGIVESPGDLGADVVIGEGRCLGNSMDYGGSGLGIFACKKEYIRKMPGRVIGLTYDSNNHRAFCMTLQTREQHIRRGKATSNICTNEGLNALAATVYLSWLGGKGLARLGHANFERGQKLKEMVTSIKGFDMRFSSTNFNEFVVKTKLDPNVVNSYLLKHDVMGGLILEKSHYPDLENCMLFGISEVYTEEDIEKLVKLLEEVS